MGNPRGKRPQARRRFDAGRAAARLLCLLFGLVGALPLGGAALARTEGVRNWAAAETARVLESLLGIRASYEVTVGVLPLEIALVDVAIAASDGGTPALRARRVAITPRIFSLLGGRLDVGDIEIDQPEARLVVRDGKLSNVRYRLPESSDAGKLERAPFASIAITEARAHLDIDGTLVETGPVDVDVFAEAGPVFEIALRAGRSTATLRRLVPVSGAPEESGPPAEAVDEDVLCQLDLRARADERGILVRRLSMIGAADDDPKPNTRPSCTAVANEDDAKRVAVRLSQVRTVLKDGEPSLVHGHVVARLPVSMARRFDAGEFGGWVAYAGDVHYEAGKRLPELRGRVKGRDIVLGAYRFAEHFDGEIEVRGDVVRAATLTVGYGLRGVAKVTGVEVRPFEDGIPLKVGKVDAHGLRFQDFMENIDVTPDTIISWNLEKTVVSEFEGTLDPLKLDGDLYSETKDFEVFDRAYHRKDRKHVIGVRAATVRGRFGARADGIQFSNTRADFGHSRVGASVVVGFDNTLRLRVDEGSKIDLADVSPLVDIPMAGVATLSAQMSGLASEAELSGDVSISGFALGGFPFGDLTSAKVRFKPLKLQVFEARGKKGDSDFHVPTAQLDFDTDATLLVDAVVESDRMEIRDFFHMWHFDEDPRFAEIAGTGKVRARVHYDMGGKKDRCKTGYLRVDGNVALSELELFAERYDRGAADFDFRWFDQAAGTLGMDVNVSSVSLAKGSGSLLGNVQITDGGVVRAHLVGTNVPLAKLQSLGDIGQRMEAQVSAVAEVSGTVDAMAADVAVRVTPTRIGRSTLPGSDLFVALVPHKKSFQPTGKTACGRPVPAPYDPSESKADEADGVFRISGKLFGGQVLLEDVAVTRQRNKVFQGKVSLRDLDLGAMAELSPLLALSERRAEGRLSADIDVSHLSMNAPRLARGSVNLRRMEFGRAGYRLLLEEGPRLDLSNGRLSVPALALVVKMPGGQEGRFDASGRIDNLGGSPTIDLTLRMRPTDLSGFTRFVPRADRLGGVISGQVSLKGPLAQPKHTGRFALQNGALSFRGTPLSLTDVQATVGIESDQIRLIDAHATVGGGQVQARGSVPIRGTSLGQARGAIIAREVNVPLGPGVKLALDADLEALWKPEVSDSVEGKSLPRLTGDVTLRSFEYTRKVTMNADIASLGKRGRRTQVESYDPADDLVEFNVRVSSTRALTLENDLIEAKLVVEDPGLELTGTNQRFGMRGQVAVVKGGRIRLRRSEFEITNGIVRFDDAQRIAPKVDVTAVTDYTRYDDAASDAPADPTGASTSGGRWRITLRAHGDSENLRVDLTSEPELGKDDIFLLLTLGLTRAELDQAQSASAGQSVALEALGRLTGADEAVTKTIPVIDEFRFGSAYSSRTGRTEPTVTIGKRLSQRIRAYVTSGLSESREIRSNLQWRLSPRISVEGSYDNVNDISSSGLGNLGADVRWRLEFE